MRLKVTLGVVLLVASTSLAVAQIKEILFGHPDPARLAIAAVAIGAPAAVALWIATRRLRGQFAVS